jgi:TDG/mug DNA glycosylase family protein
MAKSSTTTRPRFTKEELAAAHGKSVPDVIAPNLRVLFCGINPGLFTAAQGCHFAGPSNRFWPALHESGWTPRRYHAGENRELLKLGIGITNIVNYATRDATELTREQLEEGGRKLRRKVLKYKPRALACLGVTAYRVAFGHKAAAIGRQPDHIGDAQVWVLPNPSGLNAHYKPADFARLFRELREAVD